MAKSNRHKPGMAFDAAQWQQIGNEIEHSIAGGTKVGRDYSFSGRRVKGSWQGEHQASRYYRPLRMRPVPLWSKPTTRSFWNSP